MPTARKLGALSPVTESCHEYLSIPPGYHWGLECSSRLSSTRDRHHSGFLIADLQGRKVPRMSPNRLTETREASGSATGNVFRISFVVGAVVPGPIRKESTSWLKRHPTQCPWLLLLNLAPLNSHLERSSPPKTAVWHKTAELYLQLRLTY